MSLSALAAPRGRKAWIRWMGVAVLAATSLLGSGCMTVTKPQLRQFDPDSSTVRRIEAPAKVHLADGSVAIYTAGILIWNDSIVGRGRRYDLLRQDRGLVESLPLDGVSGIQVFDAVKDAVPTTMLSLMTYVGSVGAALAVACHLDRSGCMGGRIVIHGTRQP